MPSLENVFLLLFWITTAITVTILTLLIYKLQDKFHIHIFFWFVSWTDSFLILMSVAKFNFSKNKNSVEKIFSLFSLTYFCYYLPITSSVSQHLLMFIYAQLPHSSKISAPCGWTYGITFLVAFIISSILWIGKIHILPIHIIYIYREREGGGEREREKDFNMLNRSGANFLTLQAMRWGQNFPKPKGGGILRRSVTTSRCLIRPL